MPWDAWRKYHESFNPGDIRESDIHQNDVRFESLDHSHRGGFGSCLADDGNALVVV